MGTVLRSLQQAPNLLCDVSSEALEGKGSAEPFARSYEAWRLMGNIIFARRGFFFCSSIAEVCPSYSDSIFLGDFAQRMLLCALFNLLLEPWGSSGSRSCALDPIYWGPYPCVLWYSEMLRVRGEKEINARWLAQLLMSNPRILDYAFLLPPFLKGEDGLCVLQMRRSPATWSVFSPSGQRRPAEAWSVCLGTFEHWSKRIAEWKQYFTEAQLTELELGARCGEVRCDYPPNSRDELCQQAEKDFVDASRLIHDVSAVEALETPENRPFFMDYDWLVSQEGKTTPALISALECGELFRAGSPSRAVGARLSAGSES